MENQNKHYFQSIIQALRLFFVTGWMSIATILTIVLLLTIMPQGGTLVIELLSSPFQGLIFIVLTIGLSLVLSHYPEYLEKNRWIMMKLTEEGGLNNSLIKWKLEKEIIPGIGYITYSDDRPNRGNLTFRTYQSLKRTFGIFLFYSVIYVLISTYEQYINPEINISWGFHVIILLVLLCVFRFIKYLILEKGKIKIFVRVLTILYWLTLGVIVATVLMSYQNGWSAETFWLYIALYILMIFVYIIFRNIRSKGSLNIRYSLLRYFYKNTTFLVFMSLVGWFSFILIVYSHLNAFKMNSIIVLLSYMYVIYGIIVIPLKLKMYYTYIKFKNDKIAKANEKVKVIEDNLENVKEEKIANSFLGAFIRIGVPILFFALIVSMVYTSKTGNELHLLKPINEGEVIEEDAFVKKLKSIYEDSDTLYFIASYGGGLTANIWNSKILDSLTQRKSNNILESTVAMSGVSGGAMGQGIYTAIYNKYKPEKRSKLIDDVANTDFLTTDITYMLGFDYFREFFLENSKFEYPDRAKKSLNKYQELVGDCLMSSLSFRNYYKKIFDKKFYPALLVNSSSTHYTRGVSCSIELKKFDIVFPGADNILDLQKGESLSYLDALSTTNRFPFVSPAAKIEAHGHYLDGGYFENSGMLSLYNFYQYLSNVHIFNDTIKGFGKKPIVFLQIMNSKEAQVMSIVNSIKDSLQISDNYFFDKTKETGEIMAVLSTGTSISKLPKYMDSFLRNIDKDSENVRYVPIVLPYRLDENDFKKYFSSDEISSGSIGSLINEKITRNNNMLNDINDLQGFDKWSIAEPPLARVLSKETIKYMDIVIKKGKVFDGL